MKNEEIKKLALFLAQSETEKEVVGVLTQFGLWEDRSSWKEIDESTGNWSTIGNQQSAPDTALVEKIINSVDAVLTKECLARGIDPTSKCAPKNIKDAQREYFGIWNGKLSSIDSSTRSKLSENIFLVASGKRQEDPSYAIIDKGEGQSPENFKTTFLSLNKGNKNKIQFVQGKFGMGGTGVFRFGSAKHNLQLIISKRNQEIKSIDKNKDSLWGVTIIRRIPPTDEMKSSVFTYLAPEGKILSFESESLLLLPSKEASYDNPIKHGTFIKIYDYQIGTGRLKSDATRHLHNRLSLLMPDIALPIKVVDTRFKKSPHKVLSGLSVRLDEDKRENLEHGFPGSGEMTIKGQKMDYSIYAFKPGKRKVYAGNEGIIFTVNGQTHGYLPKSLFSKKSVGMDYLADSILVTVDCSNIDRRVQEDLVMPSRDRLVEGQFKNEIEEKIEDIIRNHAGLKELRLKRREEEVGSKIQDLKPIEDIINKMIKDSPSVASLFGRGTRIKNPFRLTKSGSQKKFEGQKFPTYFKLAKEYSKEKPKNCPVNNKSIRVEYETDVESEYFKRDKNPGDFYLRINGDIIKDYSLNLWNGVATLTIKIPKGLKIGDKIAFETEVTDKFEKHRFLEEFYVVISKAQDRKKSGGSGRKKPLGDDLNGNRKKLSSLDIPNMIEVRKNDWSNHKFNSKSSLRVVHCGEGAEYDYYINMDNDYLLTEIKANPKTDPRTLEARYKYGMVFFGISIINFNEKDKPRAESDQSEKEVPATKQAEIFTKAISLIFLSMITTLSNIDIKE